MRFQIALSAALVSSFVVSIAQAGVLDELSAAQAASVKNGETVSIVEEVQSSAWPKVRVYKRVEASPEEAAAVFADFEDQKNFIPDLTQSTISKRDGATVQVDYDAKLPFPINRERYSVLNTASLAGGTYKFVWKMVRSDNARSIDGTARFEAMGSATLLAYTSLIVPSMGAAGMVKKQAIQKTITTTELVARRAEEVRTKDSAKLARQIQVLRKMLD